MIRIGTYKWKNMKMVAHRLYDGRIQLCHLVWCKTISVEDFNGALALGLIERII